MIFPLALAAMIVVDKMVLSPRSSEDRRRRKRRRKVRVRRRPVRVIERAVEEETFSPSTSASTPLASTSQPSPVAMPLPTAAAPEEEFAISQPAESSMQESFNVEAEPPTQSEAEGFTFSE